MNQNQLNEYGSVKTSYVASKDFGPVTSFSGSDVLVDFVFPAAKPVRIGVASTITYSSFREQRQLRVLGRISTKGIVRGPRTIGGSLIFTVIDEHVGSHIMKALKESSPIYQPYDRIKPDELPPFDIVLTFGNEYGQSARMVIYGVTIVEDGMVLSVDDIFTENTMMYLARDIDLMRGPYDPNMKMYTQQGHTFRGINEAVGKFSVNKIDSTSQLQAYWASLKKK